MFSAPTTPIDDPRSLAKKTNVSHRRCSCNGQHKFNYSLSVLLQQRIIIVLHWAPRVPLYGWIAAFNKLLLFTCMEMQSSHRLYILTDEGLPSDIFSYLGPTPPPTLPPVPDFLKCQYSSVKMF